MGGDAYFTSCAIQSANSLANLKEVVQPVINQPLKINGVPSSFSLYLILF
jgi:hypothetical protein